jgi:hypothetical protein
MLRNAMMDLPRETGGSLGTEGEKLQAGSPFARRSDTRWPPKYNENRVFGLIPARHWYRKDQYFKWLHTKFVTRRINGIFWGDQRIQHTLTTE